MFNFTRSLIFLLFFTFFFNYSHAESKVAYIDVDLILNKSNASKSLFDQLKEIETNKFKELNITEKKLKKEENKILSSKNILSKDQYNKDVNIFKKKISNYQNKKKDIIGYLKNSLSFHV